MVSHALSPVVLIYGYILEATRTWYMQYKFFDCRCDIVCIWYNDNFLTKGAAKFKSEQFSEFGSQTVT